ncbi:MAG: hypothetical protein HW378_1515 [Anaerolineales bacterium]|nr:hypothetical protein [Anaerolineales bacterium]
MLRGKGIWIRRITACENGDLDAIAARARAASFTHVLLKVADGADACNLDPAAGFDHALELTTRLTEAGIDVWGWQQVYGDTPLFKGALHPDYHRSEAACALQRMEQLQAAGARGFVVVAGGDYERAHDRARKAGQFSAAVRNGLGGLPIALSAWKYPQRHPRFPWADFRAHCDFDLPQIFWIGKHGEAAKQLETSTQKFAALQPRLPYVPAGPAFFEHNWRPAPDDLVAFFEKAIALGLPAANLWDWDDLGLTGDESHNPHHLDFREHWKAAADFEWTEPTFIPFWLREPEPVEAVPPATQPEPPTPAPSPKPEEEFEPVRPYHPDDEELETELDFAPALSFALEPEADELPAWLQEPGPAIESEPAISFGIEAEEDFEPVRPHYPEAEEGGSGPELAPSVGLVEEIGPVAFSLESAPVEAGEEFEPVRPYHPEVEAEPVTDSEVRFALEIEEAALPEWLQEAEASDLSPVPLSPAEFAEELEPVLPYRPPAEPGPVSEPEWRIALEAEEAALPDWLTEPEFTPAAPEPLPPAEPAEEFEPDWPYPPNLEPEPPVEPLPSFAPEVEEATPREPLEPQPPAEPEEEFEPVRPYHPDDEEPGAEFDFAPAFGLAPETEDEDLPDWLKESGPVAFAPVAQWALVSEDESEPVRPHYPDAHELAAPPAFGPATAETVEDFEPVRPYHPDTEEIESQVEASLAFNLVSESEDEELPEWLRESQPAAGEAEPEPEPVVFETHLEPAAAVASEPAPARPKGLVMAPAAPTITEGDTVSQFFSALRNGQLDGAVALYGPEFSHVNPERVERDRAAVRDFYERMLQRIEGAGLVWLFMRRTRLTASAQWVTCDKAGRPMQGVDSFHLNRDGQIVYHHTSFRPGAE